MPFSGSDLSLRESQVKQKLGKTGESPPPLLHCDQASISMAVAGTPGARAGDQQGPRLEKAWYLDAPENAASPSLLAELGIVDYAVHLVRTTVLLL